MNIGDEARKYEAPKKLVISDLDEFPVNIDVLDGDGINENTNEAYSYKYIKVGNNSYRIPGPVLEQIAEILKLKPSVTRFKTTKTGSGMGTRYKTEALD